MKLSPLSVLLTALPIVFAADPAANLSGGAETGERRPYIVVLKESPGNEAGSRLERFARHRRFGNVAAAAVDLDPAEAQALAADPEVEFVAPDREVSANLDVVTATVNANVAWTFGQTGKDIGVAVIDSGITESVKDLGDAFGKTGIVDGKQIGRVVYSENFLEPLKKSNGDDNDKRYEAKDDYGHGTHIAGIIAGNGYYTSQTGATRKLKGIAPIAKLINLKVLDAKGKGTDSRVIEAIDRAISLKSKYKIRIVNLALGRRVYSSFVVDPLCKAVERAWKAGLVVVVAAGNEGRLREFGNEGYGTIQSPANSPYVITVGATRTAGTPSRSDDEITTYSSKGPTPVDHVVKPDLVAPGNLIESTMASGFLSKSYPANLVDPLSYDSTAKLGDKSYFITLSGTSMAAAVTSGSIACLLDSESKLTPDQVKARLMLTATKDFRSYGTFYFDYSVKIRKFNTAIQRGMLGLADYQETVADAQKDTTSAQSAYNATLAAYQQATGAVAAAQALVTSATAIVGKSQAASDAAVATATQLRKKADDAEVAYEAANKVYGKAKTPENSAAMAAALDAFNAADAAATTAEKNRDLALKTLKADQDLLKKSQDSLNSAVRNQTSAKTKMDEAAADLAAAQQVLAAAQQELQGQLDSIAMMQQQVSTMGSSLAQFTSQFPNGVPIQHDIFTVGAGYLDLGAALNNKTVAAATLSARSPVAFFDAATNSVSFTANYTSLCGNPAVAGSNALWGTTICGNNALWGTNALWGSNALWGTSAVWGTHMFLNGSNALWGSSAVWGTSSATGFNALWGTSAVWGTNALWGSSIEASSSIDILIDGDLTR